VNYRDTRNACHHAALFIIQGEARGGTILNASHSGLLVYIGPNLRRGQRVVCTIEGRDRRAAIVRLDRLGNAGLRLERPLSRSEIQSIVGPGAGRHARMHALCEM
jgi:hypothetical protein